MDEMKTLYEICNSLGVSRRTVQGYELLGLVSSSGKNKFGYLLYDEAACNRIERIRLYQQLGFKRKEIKELLDAPSNLLFKRLEVRVEELKFENLQVQEAIKKAYELMDVLGKERL